MSLYRDVALHPLVQDELTETWERLDLPVGVPVQGLPDRSSLNFFAPDRDWLDRRIRNIEAASAGLLDVADGKSPPVKVLSSKYASGLPNIKPNAAKKLGERLARHGEAARSQLELLYP